MMPVRPLTADDIPFTGSVTLSYCPACGKDSCDGCLGAVRPAQDVMTDPAPVAIIDKMLWAGAITTLVAESGTGKTFLNISLVAAISSGTPWHGRPVQHGSVVYLLFEGDAFGLRLRAFQQETGDRFDHLYVLRLHDPLSPQVTRDEETPSFGERQVRDHLTTLTAWLKDRKLPPVVLLVIDTVRASLVGSEDGSDDVAAYLRVVRRLLAALPGAAALLTHHAGWQDGEHKKKRERGSSTWRGNCDATFYLELVEYHPDRGEAELQLSALKTRDADRPPTVRLMRRRVGLPETDAYGQQVESCVIGADWRTKEDRAAAQAAEQAAAHERIDLATLQAIHKHPAVTSQDRLKLLLNAGKGIVGPSLSRLLAKGWIELPARQRQPYTITHAGQGVLTNSTNE